MYHSFKVSPDWNDKNFQFRKINLLKNCKKIIFKTDLADVRFESSRSPILKVTEISPFMAVYLFGSRT